MNQRMTPRDRLVAWILAGCLAACGSSSDPAPSVAPAGGTVAGNGAAAASTTPSPVSMPVAPARPARIAAKASPSIEECVERNIHDKEYDSMNPRDARRRLRRLQVMADCEQQLAAR